MGNSHSTNKNYFNQPDNRNKEQQTSEELDTDESTLKKKKETLLLKGKQLSTDKISKLNAPPSTIPTVTDEIYVGTFSSSSLPKSADESSTCTPEIVKEKLRTLQLDGSDFVDELRELAAGSSERCMTPITVLKTYGNKLTPYEIMEVGQYKEIYFFGENAKKGYNVPGVGRNSHYDNSKHFYRFVRHDHLAYRYEALDVLGHGSFGEAFKAYDHRIEECVAIKISKNKPWFSKYAEREIRMLQYIRNRNLNDVENIVVIKNAFTFRNHTCMVLELLSENLHELLKRNGRKGFSLALTQKFASSILKGLKFLSCYKILHGDIKPANIIKCFGSNILKLSDFGLSTFVTPKKPLTNHNLQTLWYRAPEVMLGGPYGIEADMWGFGCVVSEMIIGRPLLLGEDECDQMALIIEMLGVPPSDIIKESSRRDIFFRDDKTPLYCNLMNTGNFYYTAGMSPNGTRRGHPGSRSLSLAIGENDAELLDFIGKCLTWDPSRRITPQGALHHPFMRKQLPKPPSENKEAISPLRMCRKFNLTNVKHLYAAAFQSSLTSQASCLKLRAHTDERAEARHSSIDSDLSGF